MALQTTIDKENGPTDGVGVMVTVWDDAGGDLSVSDAVARAQIDAPTEYFSLAQDARPSVQRIAPHAVEVTIGYRQRELSRLQRPTPQETNTISRTDRGGPWAVKRKHMLSFLNPIGVFDSSGDVTANHTATKWLINQQGPGFDFNETGAWIEPLQGLRTVQYTAPAGVVTDAYIDGIEALLDTGAFNDDTFLTRPARTLQLVQFDFSDRTPDDSILTFVFGYKAVVENLQITNDIIIPVVRGTDYYYTGGNRDGFDETTGAFQRIPRFVFVGEVWPVDDYDAILNLPES